MRCDASERCARAPRYRIRVWALRRREWFCCTGHVTTLTSSLFSEYGGPLLMYRLPTDETR